MATPTAMMAYSEQLRRALKAQFLADSDDSEREEEGEAPLGVVSSEGTASLGLRDLEAELEIFREHDVVKGILDKGCDLQRYAREVEEKLRRVELDSIQDYIQESDNLSSLHHQVIAADLSHHFGGRLFHQIHDCDRILVTMEQMLGKFQSDLGQVSEEIRQLQSQSQTMSVKLRNRRAAEEALGNFIDHIAVPDDMINSVLESEVYHTTVNVTSSML